MFLDFGYNYTAYVFMYKILILAQNHKYLWACRSCGVKWQQNAATYIQQKSLALHPVHRNRCISMCIKMARNLKKMRFLKGLKLSSHDEAKSFKSLHETRLKMFDRTTTTLLFNSAIFFVYLAFSVTLFSIELSTHYINKLQINWQASTYCNMLYTYYISINEFQIICIYMDNGL